MIIDPRPVVYCRRCDQLSLCLPDGRCQWCLDQLVVPAKR